MLAKLLGGMGWQVWAIAGVLALSGMAYTYHHYVVNGLEAQANAAQKRALEYRERLSAAEQTINELRGAVRRQNEHVEALAEAAQRRDDAATARALRALREAEAGGEAPTGPEAFNSWIDSLAHPSQ